MMHTLLNWFNRRRIIGVVAVLFLVLLFGLFAYRLDPASADAAAAPLIFEVRRGEGFREIIARLSAAHLIRSSFATEAVALLNGSALRMQPGLYRLSPVLSTLEILRELTPNGPKEVAVTIPEGSNLYQIDAILADALVIRRGELVSFQGAHGQGNLEGKLFPDTYRFFVGSDIKVIVQKFLENFNEKTAVLLTKDGENAERDLVVASIVDKEVPDPNDQKMVAGILWKRLKAGMPLQADAAVCYAKLQKQPPSAGNPVTSCYPLAPLDYRIDSPYNTYLYKGLPPGPIGNPGISAIRASISPKSSPYWFYLSDPKTGKTIFAKTLDEQAQNKVKYLERN